MHKKKDLRKRFLSYQQGGHKNEDRRRDFSCRKSQYGYGH